jgi:hypothetical protein
MTIKVSKPAINIREELADLKQDTGLKGQELMRADTAQEARTAIGAGRKNLIINGGFDVWQRGTSASGTSNFFTTDRWSSHGYSTNSTTVSREINTSTSFSSSYYARVVSNDDRVWFQQKIEGLKQFSNQTLTISFWVKSSTGLVLDEIEVRDSSPAAYDQPISTTLTSSWQKITKTFTVSDLSSLTPSSTDYLNFTFVSIGTGTLDIAQVQLEFGKVATDFEQRSYGEELALCQRYYWNTNNFDNKYIVGHQYQINSTWFGIHFPTSMRVSPTLTGTGGTSNSYTIWAVNSNTNLTPYSSYPLSLSSSSTYMQITVPYSQASNGDGALISLGTGDNAHRAFIEMDAEL